MSLNFLFWPRENEYIMMELVIIVSLHFSNDYLLKLSTYLLCYLYKLVQAHVHGIAFNCLAVYYSYFAI